MQDGNIIHLNCYFYPNEIYNMTSKNTVQYMAETDEVQERLYRVCLFSVLFLIFYVGTGNPQENLLYTTGIAVTCYMFVSMCYPTVAVIL